MLIHSCNSDVIVPLLNLCEATEKTYQAFDEIKFAKPTTFHTTLFFSTAGALNRPQRSASTGNAINTSSLPYIEVLRGRDGRDGRDGVPGPRGPQGQRGEQGVAGPPGPRNGGVVYTRWGKTSCPNDTGTELVYAGRAGGSHQMSTGGGANYLCMPNDPDYLGHQSGVQWWSFVYMELSITLKEDHSKLFTATMSPVLCAMLQ